MNASKRKFNALLNSLGNRSTTSLSSKPPEINNGSITNIASELETDSQIKKRRIGRPVSAIGQNQLRSTSSIIPSAMGSMVHKKSASVAPGQSVTLEAPKYAPWDRTAFLERLRTFSNIIDWTPKPAKVNEVEWAKRGWVNKKWERVRCELCNIEILVKLNIKEVDGKEERVLNPWDMEPALVDKYAELIVTSHDENCLWRARGCDDTIFHLSLTHPSSTLQSIRERYNALCAISDKLPYMHNIYPSPNFDLQVILSYLPKNFFLAQSLRPEESSDTIKPEVNTVAFVMALFGWTGRPGDNVRDGAAICNSCFRTLGLWLFKSKEVNEAGEAVREATIANLDPIKEHREYCPWRNARSQSGGTSTKKSAQGSELTAWEITFRVLKNDYLLRSGGENKADKKYTPGAETSTQVDPDDADAQSIRDEKDKERWARLRRVKSLFDMKSTKKAQRTPTKAKGPN